MIDTVLVVQQNQPVNDVIDSYLLKLEGELVKYPVILNKYRLINEETRGKICLFLLKSHEGTLTDNEKNELSDLIDANKILEKEFLYGDNTSATVLTVLRGIISQPPINVTYQAGRLDVAAKRNAEGKLVNKYYNEILEALKGSGYYGLEHTYVKNFKTYYQILIFSGTVPQAIKKIGNGITIDQYNSWLQALKKILLSTHKQECIGIIDWEH